jgi:hypothetical protein
MEILASGFEAALKFQRSPEVTCSEAKNNTQAAKLDI